MNAAEQLKIVILGHVDHGKSTLIGRLFHETGSLPEGRLEQLQQAARRRGVGFEWANLMDALQAERDQNISIDTAQIWFRTTKRRYVIIDAPGHQEFIKNMVTGAAQAEAALVVIDAREGVQENTRRHGYLLNFLGIRQVVVLVNKMDLVNYAPERFRAIETEYCAWLQQLSLRPRIVIPISARHGDNISAPGKNLPWWKGPTVVEALDQFEAARPPGNQPLRFPVQDVYRFDERRILAGRVESGCLKVGDRLVFAPSYKTSAVKTIERWNVPARDCAEAGESIGVTLTEQVFVERGAIGALENTPPYALTSFRARVFWLGKHPFAPGRNYRLKLATQEARCQIEKIERVIDAATLQTVERPGEPVVNRHEAAELVLRTMSPVAFDTISEAAVTGRFVLVDGFDIAGGGVILPGNYPRRTADSLHKSPNIYWTAGRVTAAQRTLRHGHSGRVVWLTGLSCSGKTTIAAELERELFERGKLVYVLDGDNVRHGLCADLAFSPEDRRENIRRVGEVARLFADAGVICVTAFISPYRADRDTIRRSLAADQFIEVYLNAPLEVCEQRDAKGLYAKAHAGEISDFTGVSAPYEPPLKPEMELLTAQLPVGECVARIMAFLANAEK
ncbi:MAG TPA: adenylyl-sulfate kinase [Candidatus Paceibacterota bacterium]|nr:adenylyl-sulfate kinase [Verrucomicrobiota bacterium]HSA12760.1 adenylyl-sulfate kinase [Candidatus Paceibacterota bacterium]